MADSVSKRKTVSIAKCINYEYTEIRKGIVHLLESLGGISAFVGKGQKVALKPNILMGAHPDKCVTTHPAVIRVVADLVKEAGAYPFIIDSPAASIPHSKAHLRHIYKKCGYHNLGIPLNEDLTEEIVTLKNGRVIKRIEMLKALFEADVIINLPKVKTHCFMILSCAIKNLFGAVPGLLKVGYHSKLKNPGMFGGMLLDIANLVKPTLNIVDGVWGMEGNGPSSGKPVHLGRLLASRDIFALDFIICNIIGLEPGSVPYIKRAINEGICPANSNEIEIISSTPIKSPVTTFQLPETIVRGSGFFTETIQRILNPVLNHAFTLKPEIIVEKCVGCGACVRGCPERIIEILQSKKTGMKPAAQIINRKQCIHCYCCHEMCPHEAVRLARSTLYRIIND